MEGKEKKEVMEREEEGKGSLERGSREGKSGRSTDNLCVTSTCKGKKKSHKEVNRPSRFGIRKFQCNNSQEKRATPERNYFDLLIIAFVS